MRLWSLCLFYVVRNEYNFKVNNKDEINGTFNLTINLMVVSNTKL